MHCLVKCKGVASVWNAFLLSLRANNENSIHFSEWIKYWCYMNYFSIQARIDILNTIAIFA